jgi:hypothetical protein
VLGLNELNSLALNPDAEHILAPPLNDTFDNVELP